MARHPCLVVPQTGITGMKQASKQHRVIITCRVLLYICMYIECSLSRGEEGGVYMYILTYYITTTAHRGEHLCALSRVE